MSTAPDFSRIFYVDEGRRLESDSDTERIVFVATKPSTDFKLYNYMSI